MSPAQMYKKKIDLFHYADSFKKIVLEYVNYSLKHHEWSRLRLEATDQNRRIPKLRGAVVNPNITPEELVEIALDSTDLSVEETLVGEMKSLSIPIGELQGQKIYYVQRFGIFLWELDPAMCESLSIWLTYPAFPVEL